MEEKNTKKTSLNLQIKTINENRKADLLEASNADVRLDLITKKETWKKIAKLSDAEKIRSNHNEVKEKYKSLLELMQWS